MFLRVNSSNTRTIRIIHLTMIICFVCVTVPTRSTFGSSLNGQHKIIREQKKWSLVAGTLFKHTPGLFLGISYYFSRETSLSANAALLPAGYHLGGDFKWSIIPNNITPFIGLGSFMSQGFSASTHDFVWPSMQGVPQSGDKYSDNSLVEIETPRTYFLYPNIGFDYHMERGFVLTGTFGYAIRVAGISFRVKNPSHKYPALLRANEGKYGPGMLYKLSLGYAF